MLNSRRYPVHLSPPIMETTFSFSGHVFKHIRHLCFSDAAETGFYATMCLSSLVSTELLAESRDGAASQSRERRLIPATVGWLERSCGNLAAVHPEV